MTVLSVRWSLFLLLLLKTACLAIEEEETCRAGEDDGSCQTTSTECEDSHDECEHWASLGECKANLDWMKVHCRKSCDTCGEDDITTTTTTDTTTTSQEQSKVTANVNMNDASDMGVAQTLQGENLGVPQAKVESLIQEARLYLETNVQDLELKDMCRNEHELCTIWAALGECDKNPTYMKKSCSPVCKSCEYLTVEGRCPIDPNAPEAWGPGDLDEMFTKLTAEPYLSKYSVEILSSPSTGGPWVLTLDDVVSEEEAERLIELGATQGYKRSTDVGKILPDGNFEEKVSTGRTSTNAWCNDECGNDEVAQRVAHRISNFTGIDDANSEYLQLLKYEPGQFYKTHHDYIAHEENRQQGARILTVYLYLNEVEAGGGTNFPKLGLTVMPKRGRALIWPSVHDQMPHMKDPRTDHQAKTVEAGVKYGANAWFHMRDFKTPNQNHCQ